MSSPSISGVFEGLLEVAGAPRESRTEATRKLFSAFHIVPADRFVAIWFLANWLVG